MRVIKTQKGFTIVETLIVLAVTGFLFVSTMILISGQVSNAQYRDTVYRVNQEIQNTINDVQNGVFNPQDNTCGDSATAGKSDCIYAGIKISITDTGILNSEYLVRSAADANTRPTKGNDFAVLASPIVTTKQLPGYVQYQPKLNGTNRSEIILYVLFNNFKDAYATIDTGGTQSYSTYYTVGGNSNGNLGFLGQTSPPIKDNYLCLSAGSRKAKIIIGEDSRLETNIEWDSGDC